MMVFKARANTPGTKQTYNLKDDLLKDETKRHSKPQLPSNPTRGKVSVQCLLNNNMSVSEMKIKAIQLT